MKENFISKIIVNSPGNIGSLEIPLSGEERKHLIITGKNGSGKTTLLSEMTDFFRISQKMPDYNEVIKEYTNRDIDIYFSNKYTEQLSELIKSGNFVVAAFKPHRNTEDINTTGSIAQWQGQKHTDINEGANRGFVQYLINLRARQAFAREEGDTEQADKIKDWFGKFENRLKYIFEDDNLKLSFDTRKLTFNIIPGKGMPFDLKTLSNGFSSIFSIVSELLMRMENLNSTHYDVEGIAIIDEIDTHLHVDLQKKILPFLIDFFPKIQFIVTTHSPFIVSSISNAVVCDLNKKIVTEDLSGYSYDVLIESFFGAKLISRKIEDMISDYDTLNLLAEKSPEQNEEFATIKKYLLNLPKYMPNELSLKIKEIELSDLNNTYLA